MRGIDGDEKLRPFRFSNFFAWLCKFIWIGVLLRPPDGEQARPRRRAEARIKSTATCSRSPSRPCEASGARSRGGGTSEPRSVIGDVERTSLLSPRHAKRQHQANDRAGEAIERQAFVHRTRGARRTRYAQSGFARRTACPRTIGLTKPARRRNESAAADAIGSEEERRAPAGIDVRSRHGDRIRARATAPPRAAAWRRRGSLRRRWFARATRSSGRMRVRAVRRPRSGRSNPRRASSRRGSPFRPRREPEGQGAATNACPVLRGRRRTG